MKEKLNEVICSPYFVRHLLFIIALSVYIFWIFYRSGNTEHSEALTGLVNVRTTHVSVFWWCFLYIVVFHLIYTYICFGRGGYRAMWSDAPVVYGYIFFFMFLVFLMSSAFAYSKLRSITKKLEYREKGVITEKKYVYKELSGGGRGGKSSYSSHDVYYRSINSPEIEGIIRSSKKNYALYQEGDTIFLEHYTSWVDDYTSTYYYPKEEYNHE